MRSTNVKLKNKFGEEVTYEDIKTITIGEDVFSLGTLDRLEVDLNFDGGDQIIDAPDDKVYDQVIVKRPDNFIASNIAKDVEIAGIVGTFEGAKEVPKLYTPSINRSNNYININNNSNNGAFSKMFKVYNNDELAFTWTSSSFNMIDKFEAENDYVISASCYNPLLIESDKSSSISISVYSIIKEYDEGLSTTDTTTKITNGLTYQFTMKAAFGYWLPELINFYEKTNGTEEYIESSDFTYSMYTGLISVKSTRANMKFIIQSTQYAFLERPKLYVTDGDYILTTDLTTHAEKLHIYLDDELLTEIVREEEDTSALTADTYEIKDPYIMILNNTEFNNKKAPYIKHNVILDDKTYEFKEEWICR